MEEDAHLGSLAIGLTLTPMGALERGGMTPMGASERGGMFGLSDSDVSNGQLRRAFTAAAWTRPAGLLDGLPATELARLRPSLRIVHLAAGQVLFRRGERIPHVFFPITAVVSVQTVVDDGSSVETGLRGPEGMVGLPVFLDTGVASAVAVCRVPGDAWELPAEALRAAHQRGGRPTQRLFHYADAVLRHAAQVAVCSRLHSLRPRCAT